MDMGGENIRMCQPPIHTMYIRYTQWEGTHLMGDQVRQQAFDPNNKVYIQHLYAL